MALSSLCVCRSEPLSSDPAERDRAVNQLAYTVLIRILDAIHDGGRLIREARSER